VKPSGQEQTSGDTHWPLFSHSGKKKRKIEKEEMDRHKERSGRDRASVHDIEESL
jgi:hypothetical protein